MNKICKSMEENNQQQWLHERKENFPKGFMIAAVFCYEGKLQLK